MTPEAAAPATERLTIRLQTVADMKPVPASLTTRDMAEARARIGGVLSRLNIQAGDRVRRGQVIGFVQDNRIGLQTGVYDAQVSAAEGEAAAAEANLTRTRDLFSHGVYAQARLDQAEARARAATGALAAAKAQRAANVEQGAQGAILAPQDGIVLSADVPAGSVIMPGQSIARITAGPVLIRLMVPEADARALRAGEKVQLDADDLGGAASEGVIARVYPGITGGEAVADVSAPNLPSDEVGRTVRAFLPVGQRQAVIAPRRYIVTRFGVDFAEIVGPRGEMSEAPVQTAPGPSPDTVEVLSGLKPGDIIARPPAATPSGATRGTAP